MRETAPEMTRELQMLMWNSVDAVLLIEDNRFIAGNQAALDLFGIDSEEVLRGTHPAELSPEAQPDGRLSTEKAEEMIALAREKGGHRFEWVHRRLDGEEFYTEVTLTPVEVDGRQLVHTVIRDIRQRKQAEQERERYTLRLHTAAEIAAQVGTILDPDELLNRVITLLKERFGLYYAHVYTLEADTLWLRAGYGEAGRVMLEHGHHIPLSHEGSLVARAARTRQPVIVNDVTQAPDFLPNPLLPETRSEVAIPILAGEEVLGVFDVQHSEADYFTQADVDVFTTLAGQIGPVLRNAELFAETQARLRVSQAMGEAHTEEEVLNAMVSVADFYPQAGVVVMLFDQEAEVPTLVTRRYAPFESRMRFSPEGTRFPADRFPMMRYISADRAYVTQNIFTDELADEMSRGAARQSGLVSMAIFPITAGGVWLGILLAASPLERFFNRERLYLYQYLAELGARALQEARLRDRLRLIQASVDAARDTILWFDAEGRIIDANPAATALLGYERSELLGKSVMEFEVGLSEDEVALIQQQIRGGEEVVRETTFLTKGGDRIPVEVAINRTVLKGQGLVFAFVRDISARKQAEQAIRESEARTRALLDAIPDLMFRLSRDGIFLDFKAERVAELAVPPEMFLGRRIEEVIPPEVARRTLEYMERVLETGEMVTYEYRLAPFGSEELRTYEARMVPSGEDEVIAIVRDVTERKRAEEQIAIFRALAENAVDSISMADTEGVMVYGNRACYELFGYDYDRREMEGLPVATFWPEGEREQLQQEVLPQAVGEGWRGEVKQVRKDGSLFDAHVTVFPVRDEQGQVLRMAAIIRDITERKRVEAERERFMTQLSAAAEISERVGAILDTDELLNTVIPMMKERFGLYHAHVYVLDEAQRMLHLRAGYGQVGEIMRQQGHKIALDHPRSLVAKAARMKEVVLSNDVTQDPDFMPNLLLPDTRAEVAVPFMVGDKVLGVFDVQADQVDFFTQADLNVFRTLAGQISNAFRIAQLFDQQRQAELAQREAAERIRAIFEAMTEGVVVTNMLGRVEDVNEAVLRMHGFGSRDEIIGRSAMELFARSEWSKASRSVRQALERGRSETMEYKMQRRDGTLFDAEQSSALLRDVEGKPSGFVSIIRDITARKAAEAERERFAAQLSTAAEVSAQIATILDPEAVLSVSISLLRERFGLYHAHVYVFDEETQDLVMQVGSGEVGRVLRERGHRIPLGQERSLVARAARTKSPVMVNDVTKEPDFLPNPLLPKTRSELAVPMVVGNQLIGVLDVQSDEANRFSQSDRDVLLTLAGQIATAYQNALYFEEIQQTAERLKEVDRLKSEFLANMSHELRTPLNSILGYTEVLLMGIDGELTSEMEEDVRAIYENGQSLLQLINDILDLTKIEAGRMVLSMEEVHIPTLVEEVHTNNQGLFHKKKAPVDFILDVDEELPAVIGDRMRIAQILNNLVSNAWKFTDQGHVAIRAYREGNWICVAVEDTGIGIAEEDLPTVFERFRQVDGSSTRRAEGTGLGLAISRHLAEMHGGRLEVESEVGKGSTFTLWLPIPGTEETQEQG